MGAKKTTQIHVTLRPREGITDAEVGMYMDWVGTQAELLEKHCTVTEKTGAERHLHSILVWHDTTDQDNVKSKLQVAFLNKLYESNEMWDTPRVNTKIKAHHDPNGLVATYFEKDEARVIVKCEGFNIKELSAAKSRVGTLIENKKKHAPSKLNLLPMLLDIHKFKNSDEILYYNKDGDGVVSGYTGFCPQIQVEECFKDLLRSGYHNMIHHWTPVTKSNIIKYWTDFQ